MRLIALAAIAAALAGCQTVRTFDRDLMSRFEMTGPDAWTMTVTTAANYPADSEKHEAIRIGWIGDFARANGCAEFEVTDRQLTRAPTDNFMRTGTSDQVGTLRYTGACR